DENHFAERQPDKHQRMGVDEIDDLKSLFFHVAELTQASKLGQLPTGGCRVGPFWINVRRVAGVTNADFKPKVTSKRYDAMEDKVIPHEPGKDQNDEGEGESEKRPDPCCSFLLEVPSNPAD